MPLPTQKTKPKTDFYKFTALLYGTKKIGKSYFLSQVPNCVIGSTEPGYNSLEAYLRDLTSWEETLKFFKELVTEKHTFTTIGIDIVDNLYKFCKRYVCAKLKIEHPADLGFGKGWDAVNEEFNRVMLSLSMLPTGLFFVSHAQEKEIETRTGKVKKIIPTLPKGARDYICGLVDMILYVDMEPVKEGTKIVGYKRMMYTKPTSLYEAGDRTGRLPDSLEFSYDNFINEFNKGVKSNV